MGDKPTGFFRGEGGAVFEMDLPLPEPMEYQLTRGQLRRVNADGTTWAAEPERTGPPPVGAPKVEWVGWAVSQGATLDDADAMTKNDLVEKYGK
jgi:hypothetical protein